MWENISLCGLAKRSKKGNCLTYFTYQTSEKHVQLIYCIGKIVWQKIMFLYPKTKSNIHVVVSQECNHLANEKKYHRGGRNVNLCHSC